MLYILLNINVHSFCQEKKPNLIETQNWIKKSIISNPYNQTGISHFYNITFIDKQMIINEECNMLMNGVIETLKSTTKINILEIENIFVSKKLTSTWLIIRVKETGKIEIIEDNDDRKFSIETELILNDSFLDKNLPERMQKAFARLIELNGGTTNFLEDKF